MADSATNNLLAALEEKRLRFGRAEGASIVRLLARAARVRYKDVASLIRFHEVLLALRAFPPNAAVLGHSEKLLNTFWKRVEQLRESGADMDDFDSIEVSGIAGTVMQDVLGFDLARWLVHRMPDKVQIAWDDYDEERAMGAVWPRFIPLLEEDALVEASIPWRRWLEAAQGSRRPSPAWLIEQFALLPISDLEKARLYETLRMPLRWDLGNSRIARTRNWRAVRRVFYHQEPLLTRSQVSLATELARRPPEFKRLTRSEGAAVMDLIREVMLVRYRELYGTTLGDPRSVRRTDIGRGIVIYLWNLPPERRLPLRAYVAGLTLKNGVPINYIEAIGLFEWIEVGFNTFYTYRGGEVAWIFAQVLRCLCHLTGATCISMYPYQLGQNNEEAIASGAFWFYRKLGFRPGRRDLLRLAEREEKRMSRNANYRTPARTLRRLAESHAFYEPPGSETGAWDQFSTRNIGQRVSGLMAKFGGNIERFRQTSGKTLSKILETNITGPPSQLNVFQNFAMVAALIPDLASWSKEEKTKLREIIQAKSAPDEMLYLRLLQKHDRLRKTLLRLGSKSP